jgi:hypothetical protein
MDLDTIDTVKNGKLTKFYFNLLKNIHTKLETKIEETSRKLIQDYENKKKELLKVKTQLDEFKKIKSSIDHISECYNYIKTNNKMDEPKQIKSMYYSKDNTSPLITKKNLLDTLENIEVRIENGEFVQAGANAPANLELLIHDSDACIANQKRLLVKKKNSVRAIDKTKTAFDTSQMNIIIKFKENRVQADDIFIRYLVAPNENKNSFSYINAVLGSNDGKNWEHLSTVNYNMLKNGDKSPIFKYPAMIKQSNTNKKFYQYFCFQSFPNKDIVSVNQVNQLLQRTIIPICNFEIFGSYYSIKNEKILFNIEEDFQEFFNLYIETQYEEASKKVDFEYVVNMFLESYKELNSIITDFKIQKAMKNVHSGENIKIGNPTNYPHLKQIEPKAKQNELDLETNIEIFDSKSFIQQPIITTSSLEPDEHEQQELQELVDDLEEKNKDPNESLEQSDSKKEKKILKSKPNRKKQMSSVIAQLAET